MMVVIEGADHVGKTTIAKRLASYLGFRYRHLSKPEEDFNFFKGFFDLSSPKTVWDRFHLGQLVYGRRLGYHDYLHQSMMDQLVMDLRNQQVFTLIVVDDEERLKLRLKEKAKKSGEMFSDEEILIANREFRTLSSRTDGGPPYQDYLIDLSKYSNDLEAWDTETSRLLKSFKRYGTKR